MDHLTTGTVARLLNVDRQTVVRWVSAGHLRALVPPGGKHRRIRAEDFRAFAAVRGYAQALATGRLIQGETVRSVVVARALDGVGAWVVVLGDSPGDAVYIPAEDSPGWRLDVPAAADPLALSQRLRAGGYRFINQL